MAKDHAAKIWAKGAISAAMILVAVHFAGCAGIGPLEPGKDADFVVWDISEPAELAYAVAFNPCRQVVRHLAAERDSPS